jgi:hypothetical protein
MIKSKKHFVSKLYLYLQRAEEYGLTSEIVWSALELRKGNPKWSHDYVMAVACDEWDVPAGDLLDGTYKKQGTKA